MDTASQQETLIESQEVFSGRVVRVTVDTIELPSGNAAVREVVHHRGAVGMVPLDEQGQVLLVSQWRHAAGRLVLEIPAGSLCPDEDPDQCALRELAEEIGFVPRLLNKLTTLLVAPGYGTEQIHLYLARELHPQAAEPDEDENLRVVTMSLPEAIAACCDGRICDGKSVAGLMLAREFLRREGAAV